MYIYNNNKKLILMHNNIKLSSPKDTTSIEVPIDPVEPPTVVNFTVSNPYDGASTNVIKMTPHIHTTDSDGRQSNSAVVTAYKNAGYGAIAITNHNSPSKGYTALSPQQNISGITHIRGTEESQDAKHIGVIGCTSVAGNTTDKPTVLAYHRKNNPNAFLILNHPNLSIYGGDYSDSEILNLDYDCIELFDAAYDDDYPTNVEDKWDMVLSSGRLIWGSCSDDCHDITDSDGYDEFCHGWIDVLSDVNDQESILTALKNGHFYGCVRHDISISYNSSTYTITATSSSTSKFEFIGYNGVVYKTVDNNTSASYTINGDEKYIRVKSTSKANTENRAYSQPFIITNN